MIMCLHVYIDDILDFFSPNSLYYQVLRRIPAEPIEESFLELSSMRCYGKNGEIVVDYDRNLCFYECHYPPCSNIESQVSF